MIKNNNADKINKLERRISMLEKMVVEGEKPPVAEPGNTLRPDLTSKIIEDDNVFYDETVEYDDFDIPVRSEFGGQEYDYDRNTGDLICSPTRMVDGILRHWEYDIETTCDDFIQFVAYKVNKDVKDLTQEDVDKYQQLLVDSDYPNDQTLSHEFLDFAAGIYYDEAYDDAYDAVSDGEIEYEWYDWISWDD